MQRRFKAVHAGTLAALVTMGVITFMLIGNSAYVQSAHATSRMRFLPASSISNVVATFYSNPNDSGTFDVTPTTNSAFTASFSTLIFNPPTSMQSCTNSTGIDENTRPFTNLTQNADGSCSTTIAQGNGQQAGVNGLSSFEAELLAVLTVPQAGQYDMTIYADDGWLMAIGKDDAGDQPSYVAGPMINTPANGKSPFGGYPLIGANNVPSSPTQSTVTATFPAAGNYPVELDYTECCGGQLTLVVGDLSASTVTPTPLPSTTPLPGGTWINPNANQFTITGDTFHFSAHANRLNPWDPPIDHVNFTAWFLGINPSVWAIACQATSPTPGTTDVYECDWSLSLSIPNGPVTISFDVYDTAGNKNLAPNGTLQGTISRPVQSVLLAPMPTGTTLEIIHGYNDPLPGQYCPPPGDGIADHCMNQQYGLDLMPIATSTDPHPSQDIIAPADGTVDWIQGECLGLRLDTGDASLTICHFSSFNAKLATGMHIARGYLLGTLKDHIHISLADPYHDPTHSDCSASNARTCRPIPFNAGYYTIEGQSFDPGFNQDGSPIQNQYGCPTGQNCLLIVSTNQEVTS